MAERHKRGWIWSEGDVAPPGVANVERRSTSISTQVDRFAQSLPDLADEARVISERFKSACQPLVALWHARKNKFRPISPDEAKAKMEELHRAEQEWSAFVARADVQAAIHRVNRDINSRRQEHRRQVEHQRDVVFRALDDPELKAAIARSVHDLLDKAADLAVAMSDGFFTDLHRVIARRFIAVEFVRLSCAGSGRRRPMLLETLGREPSPGMRELVNVAALNMVRDGAASLVCGEPLWLGPPNKAMELIIGAAFEGLVRAAKKWKADGIAPTDIAPSHFTVQNADCSLESRAE